MSKKVADIYTNISNRRIIRVSACGHALVSLVLAPQPAASWLAAVSVPLHPWRCQHSRLPCHCVNASHEALGSVKAHLLLPQHAAWRRRALERLVA